MLFGGILALGISSIFAAPSPAAPGMTAGVVHERISPALGRGTEIGCFGTSPESPDGLNIIYVALDERQEEGSENVSKGALYVCDHDLKHHVKLRELARVHWHDGAMQIWLDNDTLAYMDYVPAKRHYVTYVIRKNGDPVAGPFEGGLGHGDTPHGSVLMVVDKRQYPQGSNLGSNGLYLYKNGTVSQVVSLEKDLGPLKDRLKGGDAPSAWIIYHPQLSSEGNYLSIRLDTEKGVESLITARVDGSDVRAFEAAAKPLHQQWYDDNTLFGHQRGGGSDQLKAQRWDRNGKLLQGLAGPGNHLAMSPDRNYLVSENIYGSDPVVMKLYRAGNTEPLAVLMNVPAGPIWKNTAHVNPAFSRDGRYVYFNKPVDGLPQVHRIDLSAWIRRREEGDELPRKGSDDRVSQALTSPRSSQRPPS